METSDPRVLQALFNQAPQEAVAYLASKGLRITFNWDEMLDEAHARAFTVAKAMRLDVLRDIRSGLLEALERGETLRQFEQALTPLLQAKGWWGKQIVVDGQGQAQQVQLGSARRLKTIYQTNLQSAYMAGRAQAQQAADAFPYLMYVAVIDGNSRPSHAALNGKIWRKDDPAWSVIFPPNGINCRCRTRALTAGQIQREGLSVSPPPEIVTRQVTQDPLGPSDKLFPTVQSGVRVTDAAGNQVTMWVDRGFNSSPLAGMPMDKLLATKAVDSLGNAAGFDLVRHAVLSQTRLKAWQAFIENTFDSGIKNANGEPAVQGKSMTAGLLPLKTVQSLEASGKTFSPLLSVDDRLLAGKKARRHEAGGDALKIEDWRSVPTLLSEAHPYIDSDTGHLVLVYARPGTEQSVQFVFAQSGVAVSAYLVDNTLVASKVLSKRWGPIA